MSRPGFSFLLCPDPELLHLEIESLLARYGEGQQWQQCVYWADEEELPDEYWQHMTLPDLMGTRRLVVLRRAHGLLVAVWNKLSAVLSRKTDTVWPIFCLEAAPPKKGPAKPPASLKKQPYWSVAEKKGWVWASAGLTARTMPDFIMRYAKQRQLTIAPPEVKTLAAALPPDAVGARNELDKVFLAAGEKRVVRPEDLAILSGAAEMDIFAFIAALSTGSSPEQVWRTVFQDSQAPSSDTMLFSFLALMRREARLLWEMAAGEQPSSWVHPQAKQRMAATARRLGTKGLARIFDLVLEAEYGIKTGRRSPEQAFEAMVAGLYGLFATDKERRSMPPAGGALPLHPTRGTAP